MIGQNPGAAWAGTVLGKEVEPGEELGLPVTGGPTSPNALGPLWEELERMGIRSAAKGLPVSNAGRARSRHPEKVTPEPGLSPTGRL